MKVDVGSAQRPAAMKEGEGFESIEAVIDNRWSLHASNKKCLLLIVILTILTYPLFAAVQAVDLALNDELPAPLTNPVASKEVGMCEACRLVVDSFERGMKDTERGKHEGGDTSWEERNLKSYQDSEVRLIEIQERICEDVKAGKAQCLSLAEDTEAEVEEWWFKQRPKNVRLFDYLCISKLKRCCPKNKFGPNCQPCESDCSEHGKCDGEGTRQGSGECHCDEGYIGSECQHCSDNHFKVNTLLHFTCRQCDSACSGCYGPGPTNCTDCRVGYYKHGSNGCIDINECDLEKDLAPDKRVCKDGTYCINTNGSYRCAGCHPACGRCIAYGADLCITCAPGYKHDTDFVCRNEEELDDYERWSLEWGEMYVNGRVSPMGRYVFYATVLLVSVMIFRSNIYIMYTFVLSFLFFLAMHECGLLHIMQEYSRKSPN